MHRGIVSNKEKEQQDVAEVSSSVEARTMHPSQRTGGARRQSPSRLAVHLEMAVTVEALT